MRQIIQRISNSFREGLDEFENGPDLNFRHIIIINIIGFLVLFITFNLLTGMSFF